MRAIYFKKFSYGQLALIALVGGGSVEYIIDGHWDRRWLFVPPTIVLITAVQAFRKWRFERELRQALSHSRGSNVQPTQYLVRPVDPVAGAVCRARPSGRRQSRAPPRSAPPTAPARATAAPCWRDLSDAAVGANEDHVQRDQRILHPERDRLRRVIGKDHAAIGGQRRPVHQARFLLLRRARDLDDEPVDSSRPSGCPVSSVPGRRRIARPAATATGRSARTQRRSRQASAPRRGSVRRPKLDRGQALGARRDSRFELLARLQLAQARLADRLHVDEHVLVLVRPPRLTKP